nr:MAG: hypothetical protein 1 [Emberiza rustica ambidensovirus]
MSDRVLPNWLRRHQPILCEERFAYIPPKLSELALASLLSNGKGNIPIVKKLVDVYYSTYQFNVVAIDYICQVCKCYIDYCYCDCATCDSSPVSGIYNIKRLYLKNFEVLAVLPIYNNYNILHKSLVNYTSELEQIYLNEPTKSCPKPRKSKRHRRNSRGTCIHDARRRLF